MAFFTGRDGMLSNQWKMRQVMIENNPVSPIVFIMATFALLAFLALMLVIETMARVTIRTKFFLKQVAFMTCLTFDILVFTA